MRVFILGHSGLLGSVISQQFASDEGFDIFTFRKNMGNLEYAPLNAIAEGNFDYIFNCAALTDVDYCEKNPTRSLSVNLKLVENLAASVENTRTKIVHFSSTGVYGSENNYLPHKETGKCTPTTVHHKHKLASERIICEADDKNLCLRLGWLYNRHHKRDFIGKIEQQLSHLNKNYLLANKDQLGNPTSVKSVAKHLKILLKNQISGLINVANSGSQVSRYNYVKAIVFKLNPHIEVRPCEHTEFERPAKVSLNESADTNLLESLNPKQPNNWYEVLAEHLDEKNI